MQGLEEAYNDLSYKDKNTMYFVMKSLDAKDGTLFLGNKKIESGLVEENIVSDNAYLSDEQKQKSIPSVKMLDKYMSLKNIKIAVEDEIIKQEIQYSEFDGGEI